MGDFAAVGTATAFKGVQKLSTLQSSPDMASNPTTETNACGRANAACVAPPSTWNGGEAIFAVCTKTAGDASACTLAEKQGQVGMLPSAWFPFCFGSSGGFRAATSVVA